MHTQLNFINNSSDGGDKEIVLFQRNTVSNMGELTVAWKVIRYCAYGCHHPFIYDNDTEVSYSDEFGNCAPRKTAQPGQKFAVEPTHYGRRLIEAGNATSPIEIQIVNAQPRGAVNINIYRNKQLLTVKSAVAPGQKAVFSFQPTLWIGVASQVVQGEPLSSAVLSNVNQEIPLIGVARADIVMTGGGAGSTSTSYVFALENVVMR